MKPEVTDGEVILKTEKGKVALKFEKDSFVTSVTPNEVGDHMGVPFTYYNIDLCVKNPEKSMEFEFTVS